MARKIGQPVTKALGGLGGDIVGGMASAAVQGADGGAMAVAAEQAGEYYGGNPLWNTKSQRKARGWN
jgi:hypothetical protein